MTGLTSCAQCPDLERLVVKNFFAGEKKTGQSLGRFFMLRI